MKYNYLESIKQLPGVTHWLLGSGSAEPCKFLQQLISLIDDTQRLDQPSIHHQSQIKLQSHSELEMWREIKVNTEVTTLRLAWCISICNLLLDLVWVTLTDYCLEMFHMAYFGNTLMYEILIYLFELIKHCFIMTIEICK